MKDFAVLTGRGVKVRLYLRPLRAFQRSEGAILDTWEGSLNILQHLLPPRSTSEQMTRHEDPEYIKQLMDVLGVQ